MSTAHQSPYRPLPPPPRPVAPAWKGGAAAVALFGALAMFTAHKLTVMYRLRGMLPGYPERVMEVGESQRWLGRETRVLALRDPARPDEAPYRIQVATWELARLRVGTLLRVRCLDDERQCYTPTSVYVDDGNLAFDRGLLVLELIGLVVALARLAPRLWSYARALRSYPAG